MEFIVRCYHKDSDDNVIGAEVVAYDGDDEIDKIILTDETLINELINRLDNLDSTFVKPTQLRDILANVNQGNVINASLFNGMQSDVFLKKSERNSYLFKPISHAVSGSDYGLGTKNEHGHVKVIDDFNSVHNHYIAGEALSAHQGYELNRILSGVEKKRLHSRFTLVKRAGVVQLTIDNWDGLGWLNGLTNQWKDIFDIPEGFRPAPLMENAKHIYCPNLFGYHLRVRINLDEESDKFNKIEVFGDGSDDHNFYGTVTWITYE